MILIKFALDKLECGCWKLLVIINHHSLLIKVRAHSFGLINGLTRAFTFSMNSNGCEPGKASHESGLNWIVVGSAISSHFQIRILFIIKMFANGTWLFVCSVDIELVAIFRVIGCNVLGKLEQYSPSVFIIHSPSYVHANMHSRPFPECTSNGMMLTHSLFVSLSFPLVELLFFRVRLIGQQQQQECSSPRVQDHKTLNEPSICFGTQRTKRLMHSGLIVLRRVVVWFAMHGLSMVRGAPRVLTSINQCGSGGGGGQSAWIWPSVQSVLIISVCCLSEKVVKEAQAGKGMSKMFIADSCQ